MQPFIDRRRFLGGLAAATAIGAAGMGNARSAEEPPKSAERSSKGERSQQGSRRRNTFSVSMNCYTWGRFDLAQCLAQIRGTPIRMLELPAEQSRPNSLIPELMIDAPLGGQWRYSFPDLQELLAGGGFRAESVDVFGYMGYPGSEPIIRRRVDFAQRLGATVLVLGCHHKALRHGSKKAGQEESPVAKEARAFMYAMLRRVAGYAADKNVTIAVEIHGGITACAAEALRTLEEVGHKNLGINFDTGNILYYNEDLDTAGGARELQALAKHVRHVHLKDIVRNKQKGPPVLTRLGQGEVDFRRAFDILHAAGFYGPFSFEVETFHGATKSDDIRDYHKDLLASIDYIRSLGEFDL